MRIRLRVLDSWVSSFCVSGFHREALGQPPEAARRLDELNGNGRLIGFFRTNIRYPAGYFLLGCAVGNQQRLAWLHAGVHDQEAAIVAHHRGIRLLMKRFLTGTVAIDKHRNQRFRTLAAPFLATVWARW